MDKNLWKRQNASLCPFFSFLNFFLESVHLYMLNKNVNQKMKIEFVLKVELTKNMVVKISLKPKSVPAPCIIDLPKMEASQTLHCLKGIADDHCRGIQLAQVLQKGHLSPKTQPKSRH